jgi:tonB-dependent siderophore receptor
VLGEAALGSWKQRRATVDVNRRLLADGSLGVRLIASQANREYFFRTAHRKNTTLYGVAEWQAARTASGRVPAARVSQGGYAIWDAMLAWQPSPHWSVQLNISSVLDKHYFAEVGLSQLKYGEPRKRKIGRQMRTQIQKKERKNRRQKPVLRTLYQDIML